MKQLILIAITSFICSLITAQSVGVGTTNPDPSAALEISSVTQGILVPRMTTAQRTAISSPATGLLVYDMTSNSFWFKSSSQWVELIDTSNTVVHKLGSDIYMGMLGRVGIGTATPSSKLEIKTLPGMAGMTHTDGTVTMQTNTTVSAGVINTTTNHSLQLNANNGTNQFTITPSGFVGIGTAFPQQQFHVNGNTYLQGNVGINNASPAFPLSFAQATGQKIALYGNGSSNFGFGLAAGLMQMHTPSSSEAIGFGFGSSAAFTENMRLTGDGRLGIGTLTPSEKLSVIGNANFSGNLTLGGGLAVGLGVAVGGAIAVAGGAGFGGAVGVGITTPNPSAQLDISSTTKGLLLPRMTSAQQNAIPNPAEGLTVYNTETNSPWYRTDNEWKEIEPDSTSSNELFVFRNSADQIYMGLMDKVGIGTTTPLSSLDVARGIGNATARFRGTTFISEINLGSDEHTFITGGKANSNVILNDLPGLGNVGIGTSTPTQKLHVEGGTYVSGNVGIGNFNSGFKLYVARGNSVGTAVFQGTSYDSYINTGTTEHTIINGGKANSNIILNNDPALGNVGIGTSTPTQKLHVEGGTYVSGNVGIGNFNSGFKLYVARGNSVGTAVFQGTSYDSYINTGTTEHTIINGGKANSNIILNNDPALGNVGIGTSTPTQKLHVEGSTYISQKLGIGTIAPNAPLQFSNAPAERKIVLWEGADNNNQFFGLGIKNATLKYQVNGTGDNHVFYAGSSSSTSNELMRIQGNGNVGIGIPAPLASLEVARGTGNSGAAMFRGTTYHSHFNYSTNEDTYIRGGKDGANVIINDYAGLGNVCIGTAVPLQKLTVQGGVYVSGNQGIGVSSPQNKVDIQTGSARTGTHPTGLPLYVTGDILAGSQGIEFRHSNGTQGIGVGFNTIYAAGSNTDQDLSLSSRGGGSLTFKTNQSERMRIDGNGNVGIGTSSPNAPLQFSNAIAERKIVLWEGANNINEFYGFGVTGSTLRYQVNATGDNHVFYAGASSSQSNELMRIQGNGNVGIGTAIPHAPLQFANTGQNRKIVLYENANNDYQFNGLGADQGTMRYQVGNEEYDHVFYAATSPTTNNELMRVKGNGNVDVAGSVLMGYSNEQISAPVPPASSLDLVCNCPAGTKVLGGGWAGQDLDTVLSRPFPGGTGWLVRAKNIDPLFSHTLTAYAICARIGN